jgi:hypothetical protein
MKMWICDGGDFVGSEYEVDLHIKDNLPDDLSCAKIRCWGRMEVGSKVHIAWLNGVHPMSMLSLGFGGYREPVFEAECLT